MTCTDYKDLYDNFPIYLFVAGTDIYHESSNECSDGSYVHDSSKAKKINNFLKARRQYSYLSSNNTDGNVYDFDNADYMKYRSRYHQRLLAQINSIGGDSIIPFSLYLNSESGLLGDLPNTIKSITEIDAWATQIVGDGNDITEGILSKDKLVEYNMDYSLPKLDGESYSEIYKHLVKVDSNIWTVNINNGGRVFKELTKQGIKSGMGISSHGENSTLSHQFLQHAYPFITYDEQNYTYKTCLNDLNCKIFANAAYSDLRSIGSVVTRNLPFDTDLLTNVTDGQRRF